MIHSELDFIAALKSRGFKKPTPEDGMRLYNSNIVPNSTLARDDMWVGWIENKAGIFGWGRGFQPFDVVLAEIDHCFSSKADAPTEVSA